MALAPSVLVPPPINEIPLQADGRFSQAWIAFFRSLPAQGRTTSKFSATLTGNGSTTVFTVPHGLGTMDVLMQVRQAAAPFAVVGGVTMAATTVDTVTFTFASAPAAGVSFRALVVG